jgi:hypothetical protein
MPFLLDGNPTSSEVSEAINYLLSNFDSSYSADSVSGQISGPTGQIVGYLYKYIAIKYADSFDGSLNFSNTPTGRLYYGIRNSNDITESTNPADYTWRQVTGGFGTTKFVWYITAGGRQIQFAAQNASPGLGWVQDAGVSINLDIITSTSVGPGFLAYFQPASLQVIRSGSPLTPIFTGVTPKLYATAGGALATYVTATADTDPTFGNNTWRIGNSSTTGLGDITYNQITIGLPTDGGGYALWPAPTAMSGTPASLSVPVRYKSTTGVITQANVAIVQFVFSDQGASGSQVAYPSVYRWDTSIPTVTGTSTYIWSAGTFSPDPSGWSSVAGASTPGFTLYRAQVTLIATAGTTTSTINWTTASVSSIGYAGGNGLSSRLTFARIAGNPSPVSATVTTTGSTSFPPSGSWGLTTTWGGVDPNPTSTDSLYQADGIYDPATNITSWTTPYISSLKVGQLSAITVNTGTLTVDTGGYLKGGQTAYNTGTGFFLGYSSAVYKFSIGSSSQGLTWDGSALSLTGNTSLNVSGTTSGGFGTSVIRVTSPSNSSGISVGVSATYASGVSSSSLDNGIGVYGGCNSTDGVTGSGVVGVSNGSRGVYGYGNMVAGLGASTHGVEGESTSPTGLGVYGHATYIGVGAASSAGYPLVVLTNTSQPAVVILPSASLPSSAQAGSLHVVGSSTNSELWFYKGTTLGWVLVA